MSECKETVLEIYDTRGVKLQSAGWLIPFDKLDDAVSRLMQLPEVATIRWYVWAPITSPSRPMPDKGIEAFLDPVIGLESVHVEGWRRDENNNWRKFCELELARACGVVVP